LRDLISTASGLAAGAIAIALIFASPWAYGGVEQSFRSWIAGSFAVASVAVGVHAIARRRATPLSATLLPAAPVIALLALAAIQLYGGHSPVPSSSLSGTPQTIYPAATRLALAGLASAVAATLIGSSVFAKRQAFDLLLFFCLLSAAAVAFFGIAMKLTGDDRLIRGMTFIGDPFARFVNRNNACAFLCAGIAAGCAILRGTLDAVSSSESRDGRWNGWIPDRTSRILVCAALLAVCIAGAFASRSRGGSIAALVALISGLTFFGRESWRRKAVVLAPLLLIAIGLVVWVGLSGETLKRFRGLTYDAVFREGRVPHWQNAMGAVRARPVFGAGVGTYGYAYQEFSTRPQTAWYEHADNQYVEVLVETGTIGAAIVLAGGLLAMVAVWKGRRSPAAATLILSLVLGQAAHAVFDYGIIVPASVLVSALLWGAGVTSLLSQASSMTVSYTLRLGVSAVALAVALGLAFGFREHRAAGAVERYLWAADRVVKPGGLSLPHVDKLIADMSDAVARRPDDAVGQRNLAELYLYRYRTASSEAMRRVDPSISRDEAWRAASVLSLHEAVNRIVASGAANGLHSLRLDPISQRDLVPAREHLLTSKDACSRLPGLYLPLSALAFLDANRDPRGLSELETACTLFPTDTDLLRTAGWMAWQAGDSRLSARCWKASFALSDAGFGSVTRRLIDEVGPVQTIDLTIADDPATVLRVINDAGPIFDPRLEAPLGRQLEKQAQHLPAGEFRKRVEANAAWLLGRDDAADDAFRTLLEENPWDIELRVNYAVACVRRGRTAEAIDQLLSAVALDSRREDLAHLAAKWQSVDTRSGGGE